MKIRGVAKRGYPVQYPENTLPSFQAAIDLNFTHVELDVHLTKDRVPVVMRDDTIDRMTNGRGAIQTYTYEELRAFSINHDEHIPRLEEVLTLLKGKMKVGIELNPSGVYVGLEEKVYETVTHLGCLQDVYIFSSNPHSLARLRMRSKEMALGLFVNECKQSDYYLLKELHATYYKVPFSFQEIPQLDDYALRKLNVQTIVDSVNTIEQMKFMRQHPEILVATNELEKFQAIYYPETITNWQKVGI